MKMGIRTQSSVSLDGYSVIVYYKLYGSKDPYNTLATITSSTKPSIFDYHNRTEEKKCGNISLNKNANYSIKVDLMSNGKVVDSVEEVLERAFANVHLSGCTTGGVAFGKFSSSTEDNPYFECVYPTIITNDIYTRNIKTGFVAIGSVKEGCTTQKIEFTNSKGEKSSFGNPSDPDNKAKHTPIIV